MKTEYVKSGLTLDYAASGALDRFGRITDHAWKDDQGSDVVRIKHDYDLAGNRMNRIDMMNSNWSESYAYDGMDQIKSMQRSGHSESWNYDQTGNWLSYNKNNVAQNRQHNKANEIQNMVSHDRNGNMTQMPSPKDGQAMNCVYDAWNRLVKVNENIRYEYNGLNQRIAKTVDGVKTLSYFNSDWQELESKTEHEASASETVYVWGLRHIDDLVYRYLLQQPRC